MLLIVRRVGASVARVYGLRRVLRIQQGVVYKNYDTADDNADPVTAPTPQNERLYTTAWARHRDSESLDRREAINHSAERQNTPGASWACFPIERIGMCARS